MNAGSKICFQQVIVLHCIFIRTKNIKLHILPSFDKSLRTHTSNTLDRDELDDIRSSQHLSSQADTISEFTGQLSQLSRASTPTYSLRDDEEPNYSQIYSNSQHSTSGSSDYEFEMIQNELLWEGIN